MFGLTDTQTILAATSIFAIVFGPLVARSSMRREKIYGGILPMIFNFVGSMAFVGILPTVLTGIIVGAFHEAVPIAIIVLATSLLCFVLFAVFEYAAREKGLILEAEQEQIWTEEDARTSGL